MEKDEGKELIAVTIYENQHCLPLCAHKRRQPSDFTDLFFIGNQAWLMAQEDRPGELKAIKRDRKEERQERNENFCFLA